MAIEFKCSSCSSTLRVPNEHSGKHARCPKCSTVNAIPFESVPAETQRSAKPDLFSSLDNSSTTPAYTQPSNPYSNSSTNYDSSETSNFYSTEGYSTEGYTKSSYSSGYGPSSHLQPHRGGTILALALLSLFCNFLLIPGFMAWKMGVSDLQQIRSGTMDPQGHGFATAGMIIGAVMTFAGVCLAVYFGAVITLRLIS